MTHRWTALTMGFLLLLLAITGSVLLYEREITHALSPQAYSAHEVPETVSPHNFARAVDALKQTHPTFGPSIITTDHGVIRVFGATTEGRTSYTVHPTSAAVLGEVAHPAWLGFIHNMHVCALGCEQLPGYLPIMDVTIPGTAWIGRDKDIAVGSFLLGLLGLLLAYLCVTGLYLWWPRKWAKAFELRLNHGRFARDTDLHKQIGLICLIPLLMWGYTGAGFELTPVKKAWYAATLSEELPRVKVEAAPSSATPLTIDEAMGRAAAALPDLTVRSVRLPPPAKKGGEQGTYTVSLSTSIDPRAHFAVPGNVHVSVDPHTGEVVRIRNRPEESWAQQAWDWNFPLHAGTVVNSWWRIPWFLAGVGLIALGITGLSTWLYRLGTKRGRARAQRARSSR